MNEQSAGAPTAAGAWGIAVETTLAWAAVVRVAFLPVLAVVAVDALYAALIILWTPREDAGLSLTGGPFGW